MKSTLDILKEAKAVKRVLFSLDTETKNNALLKMADALIENQEEILEANAKDLENAKGTISEVMLDRLALSEERIEGMAEGIRQVAELPDPVGEVLETVIRPSGIVVEKTAVPMGVVAIIYESRPNVTSDAAALALKAGNVCILRGGKEAINSNKAMVKVIKSALEGTAIPADAVELLEDTSREASNVMMSSRGLIDVLIPRGGKGLIRSVVENARVPVIETGAGNCHLYVDSAADMTKAINIAVNAKCSRPSVCNAIETLLVHTDVAAEFLPMLQGALAPYNVDLRGCERSRAIIGGISAATDEDYATEYDDYILALKVVDTLDEAIEHINKYSTGHSEAIITSNDDNANKFLSEVNSAAVYVNASTRFTDGGEFGFGAEIGISTQKLHVRGPMGLSALTTEKYLIKGNGNVR